MRSIRRNTDYGNGGSSDDVRRNGLLELERSSINHSENCGTPRTTVTANKILDLTQGFKKIMRDIKRKRDHGDDDNSD